MNVISKQMFMERATVLKRVEVDVSEFFGPDSVVFVRELTAQEREDYEQKMVNISEEGKVLAAMRYNRATVVCLATVDADGNRLFADSDGDMLRRDREGG